MGKNSSIQWENPSQHPPGEPPIHLAASSLLVGKEGGNPAAKGGRGEAFAVRKTVLVGPLAVIRVELAGGNFGSRLALARFLQKVGQGVAFLLIVGSGGLDACRRFEAFPRIADSSLYDPGEDRGLVPGIVFERRPKIAILGRQRTR